MSKNRRIVVVAVVGSALIMIPLFGVLLIPVIFGGLFLAAFVGKEKATFFTMQVLAVFSLAVVGLGWWQATNTQFCSIISYAEKGVTAGEYGYCQRLGLYIPTSTDKFLGWAGVFRDQVVAPLALLTWVLLLWVTIEFFIALTRGRLRKDRMSAALAVISCLGLVLLPLIVFRLLDWRTAYPLI